MKKTFVGSLVTIVVASTLLVGCGSRYGGIPRDPSLGPKTPTPAPTADDSPKPKPGTGGDNPKP